jgi:hypothetical protein
MMISETASEPLPRPVPQKLFRQLAEVLLIVLVFFIATGDPTPSVNETHYIARLKHFWNPAWCKGDLFLESPDTQVAFIWLFGWMTRWLSLSATAWICRTVAWVFIAWSWQRLSWRVVPRPLAAVLSAALFLALNNYGQLAGEWVVGGVEAKCFAYAFVLMAIRDMLDRRWAMVCLLLGASIAFHPIVGGWSALVCAILWLIFGRREQSFLSMLPGIIIGSILAAIGIVPALSLTWHEPADIVAEASRIYVFERLPHHLSILSLPNEEIESRLVRHAALLIALFAFGRIVRRDTQLHPIVRFAWGAVIIACVGFAIELAFLNQPLTAARFLRYYCFRLTDFAAPMAVALLATSTILTGIERQRRWAAPLLLITMFFTGWYLEEAARPRVASLIRQESQVPPADSKVTFYPDWVEVCDWIAANTPTDALFLTPRLNQSFKWRTGRPEVVNRKDIPQDARGIIEWYNRLKDIYYTNENGIERSYDSIGDRGTETVRELAQKYHAQYVLMDRGQLIALPIAFRNEEYVVYQIENRKTDNGR